MHATCRPRVRRLGALFLFALAAYGFSSARGGEPAARAVDLLPADCVFAVSADLKALRAGCGRTAFTRFMADPEMLAFLAYPLKELGDGYVRWRERFPILPGLTALDSLASGEAAWGLRLAPAAEPARPPHAVPVLVLRPAEPKAVQEALRAWLEPLPVLKLPGGQEARGGDGLCVAFVEDWLLLASRPADLDQLCLSALRPASTLGQGERWKRLNAALGDGLPAVAWADLRAVQEHLLNFPADPDARAVLPGGPAKALAALGLDGVQGLAAGLTFQDERFDFRMGLEAPLAGGPRRGLVKWVEGEGPLSSGVLARVPPEAGWFYAARADARRLLPLLADGLAAATGDAAQAQQLGVVLLGFALYSGVDLERDLLASLGDEWVVCDPGGGGALGGLFPALAVTVSLRDAARADAALQKLLPLLAKEVPKRFDARYREQFLEWTTIRYISFPLTDFSPACAIADNCLVIAPTVAALRRQLQHLAGKGQAGDIRANVDFQAVWKAAFGQDLPAAGAEGAGAAPLPYALRYLDPRRAHPARLAGTLVAALQAAGPDFSAALGVQEGVRRARVKAALHLLGAGLKRAAPKGQLDAPLPAAPREVLNLAGEGAAQAVDLGGITYRAGWHAGDPPDSIVAWSAPPATPGGKLEVLRLDGEVQALPASDARVALAAQLQTLKAGGRTVRDVLGEAAPLPRPSRFWWEAWTAGDERLLFLQEGLRLLRGLDFALLPDAERLEAALPTGLSWTGSNEWGIVSRSLTGYPLPAADLSGAAIPLGLAALALPEVFKAERANNEAAVLNDLRALAAAQRLYRLADWDGDGIHAYASSLAELSAHGLLDARVAGAEKREGAHFAPHRGYGFKLLAAQGPAAPGGEKVYAVKEHWTQGYAVLAWPIEYGKGGRRSFLLGPDGALWESDHGVFTSSTALGATRYEPATEQGWRPAE